MKKIYLLLVLLSYKSFSQDSQNFSTVSAKVHLTVTTDKIILEEAQQDKVFLKKNGVYVKAYRNNIPSSVLSDFTKKYEDAEEVTWKVDEDQVTGHFTFDQQKITLTYKKNGHLLSTRKTYDSTRMNKAVKHLIQNELNKGYRIELITEVINNSFTLYEINMTMDSKICVVRISKNKDSDPVVDEKVFYTKADPENI